MILLASYNDAAEVEKRKDNPYSNNSICLRKRCINPIFPALRILGINVMEDLESKKFKCAKDWEAARKIARFCDRALGYNFSLIDDGTEAGKAIIAADHKATQAYVSHLNGLGFDAWDYTDPSDSRTPECLQDIWRLSCYTYFPKCNELDNAKYLRPCETTCKSYIRSCSIECCDEGVTCNFTYNEEKDGNSIKTSGYINHESPSQLCTGLFVGASSSLGPSWTLLFILLCLVLTVGGVESKEQLHLKKENLPFDRYGGYVFPDGKLDVRIAAYRRPFWRKVSDYTIKEQAVMTKADKTVMNSCEAKGIPLVDVCNGRGKCASWDIDDLETPIHFCKCDAGWSGTECNIQRYSKRTAWFLSIFFGYLGFDLFYLGYPLQGTLKLMTLGGFGLWWVHDIILIGSGEIYAIRFRVVDDFPHWAYLITAVSIFIAIGFIYSFCTTLSVYKERKRLAAIGEWPIRRQAQMPKNM